MPIEGEIKQATIIGYKGRSLHVWVICPKCGNGRWVVRGYTKNPKYTGSCRPCCARSKQYKDGHAIPIPVKCSVCGKPMKVIAGHIPSTGYKGMCPSCLGKSRIGNKSPRWKGGRSKYNDGYIYIWVVPDSPFYSMCHHGAIPEHRFIMAQYLNRCLASWEIVHHINEIKNDNRIENLKLLPSDREHISYTRLEQEARKQIKRIATLEARVTLLEAENEILRGGICQLNQSQT